MTDHDLETFRAIAAAMVSEPADWQWIGPHMSQRMFGITERRAKDYAARHGGAATKMEVDVAFEEWCLRMEGRQR